MMEKSAVAKDIDAVNERERLDTACKTLLANKVILAWVLKELLEEFKGCSVKDICEKYIEGTPEISKTAVHRDEYAPEKIQGLNTEDATLDEGTTTYDIRFAAIVPGTNNKIHLYVNIEAQNDYYPGYPIVKRGIYYCCRMISSQYGIEFTRSHYEKLKKVCSIWICMNAAEKRKNSITQYTIQEKKISGNSESAEKAYDLINCIILCLGDPEDTDGILKLFDVLMSPDISAERKKKILEDEFEIEMTREIEQGVSDMCNYSSGIEQKGYKRGMEQEMKEMLEAMKASGMTQEQIDNVIAFRQKQKNLKA